MRPNEKEKIFKDITEMVKENDFSTAKNALEVKTIKKLSPRDISEILFHLLPLKTRSSKEISALLLEYNRPDLLATDEKGISLLKNMLEHGRTDLLNSVVKKIRKCDLGHFQLQSDWGEALRYLLEHHQKPAVEKLLKLGILLEIEEEKKEKICRLVLEYKDENLLHYIIKAKEQLSAEMLPEPDTTSKKQFLQTILNNYIPAFDLEENRDKLWELAFSCDADRMMKHLIKKEKDYQFLSKAAGGSDTSFSILEEIRPGKVLPAVRKEVLIQAFLSDSGTYRYDQLREKGWAKEGSRKEILSISDDVKKILGTKRYAPNRRGQQERNADRKKLTYLLQCESNPMGKTVKN